eukprot:TRINITY_DN21922_c0_g1_i6.p2 TRINITY_DN21922_c0_g1~~TRINITY_DN21922_c0_g1_i6.p2  ORF type:complete len:186 (-),score=2.31 TRINITY_DN21922_c0_g1_i6:268-825(-)
MLPIPILPHSTYFLPDSKKAKININLMDKRFTKSNTQHVKTSQTFKPSFYSFKRRIYNIENYCLCNKKLVSNLFNLLKEEVIRSKIIIYKHKKHSPHFQPRVNFVNPKVKYQQGKIQIYQQQNEQCIDDYVQRVVQQAEDKISKLKSRQVSDQQIQIQREQKISQLSQIDLPMQQRYTCFLNAQT